MDVALGGVLGWVRRPDCFTATALATPQTLPQVRARALRARPEVVSVAEPPISTSSPNARARRPERFDLIVATDILVYYSVFEQSLALANIARMLRPGVLLLSTSRCSSLPALPIASIGYSDVTYLQRALRLGSAWWYRRN